VKSLGHLENGEVNNGAKWWGPGQNEGLRKGVKRGKETRQVKNNRGNRKNVFCVGVLTPRPKTNAEVKEFVKGWAREWGKPAVVVTSRIGRAGRKERPDRAKTEGVKKKT